MSNLVESKYTEEQLKLITSTVAKGATPDELQLFLYRCKNMGLDPLKPGQVHFVKYGGSPGTIIVGIEGFRAKAQATGKLAGIKRGVIRNDKGECIGAWCEIHRSDWAHPAREEVSLSEYSTGKAMWAKMPETMCKKVAEVATLRMAFPDDLGGIYAPEEMDQAEAKQALSVVPNRDELEGNGIVTDLHSQGYITFGKHSRKKPEEVDSMELLDSYKRLKAAIKENASVINKTPDSPAKAKQTLDLIRDHLSQLGIIDLIEEGEGF